MPIRWWRDLSVSKKLYGLVGLMALLIAMELFTLLFAMDTLSAVRSFVGGEGLWSKAQKDAVQNLHRFVSTGDPAFYQAFREKLEIPLGDRRARLEMQKGDHMDLDVVRRGFLQGGNHEHDIPGLIQLIRRFHSNEYVAGAIRAWQDADFLIDDLIAGGAELERLLQNPEKNRREIAQALVLINDLNERLTVIENEFSSVLGEGSRWLEQILMVLLIVAVLTVESTGLYLTFRLSRSLNRSLKELSQTAHEVGRGHFDQRAPVRSRDELGQLAESLNKMAGDLKSMIEQKAEAENANHFKTLFLANMSHEIRTPLGVIMGLTDLMKDPELTAEDRRRSIETLERTSQNLMRIINDILDISKVESGHLLIEKSDFSLTEFLEEIRGMLQIQAERTENKLSFESKVQSEGLIRTDRVRLRQILVNLISNGLKYTKKGQITVSTHCSNNELVVRVSDNGPGIAPAFREKLFLSFSRGHRRQEGTGLGLFLSRNLAHALGGELSLERTDMGQGSTFLLRVPIEEVQSVSKKPRTEAVNSSPRISTRGMRVLVVEDSLDNQMLLRMFLDRQRIHADFANNGLEGVQMAESGDYDLILMDMQMPLMDGYTATRELRTRGDQRPIVALTAHAMKEDRERCLEAGCTDYMTKPIDPTALSKLLARFAPRATDDFAVPIL